MSSRAFLSPISTRFSASLILGLLLTLTSAPSVIVAASSLSPSPGDLIKGPSADVYYYGQDGKRYVFPNEKTYFTWYTNFSTVTTLTAEALAAIPIGGNVTYRPGVKLIKITTDPKVYAVSSQGTLRWVETETAAAALYGTAWAKNVDDIPDAFFVNYTVGSSIKTAAAFSPAGQTAAAKDIATDKLLIDQPPTLPAASATSVAPLPPAASATSSIQFTSSRLTAQAGDLLTFSVTVEDPAGIEKIEVFFDGALINTCTKSSCVTETKIPISGTKSKYHAEARVKNLKAEVTSRALTITIQANGASLVSLRVGQTMIVSGQLASATAEVDASIAINRIDISVDGSVVKGCATGARQCQWSDILSGATSSTHPVSAKVTDTLGRVYTSKTVLITIGANDLPGVTVAAAQSTIYAGEHVEVAVTAADTDGISSIDILKDGIILKHCASAAPCSLITGPWNTSGVLLTFTGQAADIKGNVGTSTESAIVSVSTR